MLKSFIYLIKARSKFVLSYICTLFIIVAVENAKAEFMRGVDLSTLIRFEDDGKQYYEYGVAKDALQIFKNHDVNWIRLRLFHSPDMTNSYTSMDLDYVTTLATRSKAMGYKFLLDFHYSDTWADPGQQDPPEAWATFDHAQLVTAIHDYSRDVIEHLRTNNVMPDMVQIGNEVTDGMLWPYGEIYDEPLGGWDNFIALLSSARAGIDAGRGAEPMPEIMIHIDRGGDAAGAKYFFGMIIDSGFDFDVMGLSFYPAWHGTVTNEMAACITMMETEYPTKDFVYAEIGISGGVSEWQPDELGSPETQKTFIEDALELAENVSNGRGVFYWEPTWYSGEGYPIRSLFEEDTNNWLKAEMRISVEAFDIVEPPSTAYLFSIH